MSKESHVLDLPVSSPSSPTFSSPKFQVASLFSSPRASIGPATQEMAGPAGRRIMGGWRGQRAATSSKAASSSGSVDGRASPLKATEASIDGRHADDTSPIQSIEDENIKDGQFPWDLGVGTSILTPPGAINELPSFGMSSPPAQSFAHDEVPWVGATRKTGDYDWANFVYAYARGRWDPVRSPHPPGQSNIVPGATTHIGTQTTSVSRPATPEKPEQILSIRRPSLEYGLISSEGAKPLDSLHSIDLQHLTDGRKPSGPTLEGPAIIDEVLGRERAQPAASDAMTQYLQHSRPQSLATGRKSVPPTFSDPFSVLQLASNSAPDMGKTVKAADEVQTKSLGQSPSQGAKTDSEVITRNALLRHESDKSNSTDGTVWQDGGFDGAAERHAGVLPFVSPRSATPSKRPFLDMQMSELQLNKSSDGSSDSKAQGKESLLRPWPTPVQHPDLLRSADAADWRVATWTSAPDESGVGFSSAGVSSHGHVTSTDDLSSVAGLRRAARRTSIKRIDGPLEGSKEGVVSILHSRSFPTSTNGNRLSIREVPSLDILQTHKSQEQLGASNGASPAKAKEAGTEDDSCEPKTSRSRTTSEQGTSKTPAMLSQPGQSRSNSHSMSTYLNVGKRVELFYREHGYLPAIIPPDELNRRQALRRYGPPRVRGDVNFDRIAHLVKLVFNTRFVLISLVGEKTQFFQTEVGSNATAYSSEWLQDVAQSRDCSFCSHAILQPTDEALVILDAQVDWRFAGNPLVCAAPHIRFYAGSPLRTSDGYNLGSLCIIDDRPWREFSPRQRHTLKEFSRVVMREMELSRDTIHLRIRDRMQHSIETFTRDCLEMESEMVGAEEKDDENPGLHRVYDLAAKAMRQALDAAGAIIFDLSHFELVISAPVSHEDEGGSKIFFPSPYQYPDITPFANFERPGTIEGVNSGLMDDSAGNLHEEAKLEEKSVPPMAVLGACEPDNAPKDRDRPVPLAHYLKVAEFLRKYRTGHYFPYTPGPFRHLLPAGMTNILLVPIFGLNKQPFALLCAYSKSTEQASTLEDLQEPSLQYLRAMGTIILSAILKKDIMLADKAKSHFISNISHELRTPLHGILAAAELLAETKLNATQGSYLETVEACGKSLLELVNHVLDFTKLSGNMRSNQPHAKPSLRCDLVKLVQEVCESSWIGQMAKKLESQQDSGIGSAYAKGSEDSSPNESTAGLSLHQQKQEILSEFSKVETVIDISFRSSGWLVKCDAGGIRRVLMNLIGNSLKFTTAGFVHVSVREIQSTDTHVVVELGVTDTGRGISRSFLEEQLFHPFTQENHLGPGTGLGLSIVNSIVQSPAINGKIDVWSTLGQGTEIRVTCELELSSPSEAEGVIYKPVLNVNQMRSVSLVGFQDDLRGQSDMKEVLQTYFGDWWKFKLAEGTEGDIVVINSDINHLQSIASERKTNDQRLPPIILLTGGRGDARIAGACEDYHRLGGVARLLFKPAGPARLEAVTDFCLQCFERAEAGKPMAIPESEHNTPLPSPSISVEEDEGNPYFTTLPTDKTPGAEDRTPKAFQPSASASVPPSRNSRPHLTEDLRRSSHHISPGPPTPADAASLLRRHSSEDRAAKSRRNGGGESPQSSAEAATGQKRPLLPTRSITYHEPRLQRHVLMSPLRSPHNNRRADDAGDYFGSLPPGASSNASTAGGAGTQETSSPSSPGSVISLDGGEGAVLKTALHNAGLLRGGVTKKRLRILSVEDNHINRKVLAAYFGKMEVDFVEASNGEEGVRLFESHPANHFDVILMDLSMPVLDGLGATTQIRKIEAERFRLEQQHLHHPAWSGGNKTSMVLSTPGGSRPSAQARAKIFALTGRSSDEDKRRAFATGADGFIVKPLGFKVLSSLLTSLSAVR